MKTAEEIYGEMKAAYQDAAGIALTDGGDMALRLYASAAQLSTLWAQADFVSRQSFPQTATGGYLDYHAEVRGLKRTGAVKASGPIRFFLDSALAGDVAVPAGTVCLTAAEIYFVTTADAVIEAGSLSCDAPAEAAEAGGAGNVPAMSVLSMAQAPTGVSYCANPSAFTGGADAEDDESLRARVLGSYRSLPNGANAAYYEAQTLDTEGVAAAVVLPRKRGLGTVDVVVASAAGIPAQELVNAVQAKLDAEREICVDIAVSAPEPVAVDVTAAVKPAGGCAFADVKESVEAALASHFTGERLGGDVLRAKLGGIIYAVPGVYNYTLAAPAADVAVGSGGLPVLGTVTITEMS